MPDYNYVHIAVVLDRSGSMGSIKSDMEQGLKDFVAEQKKQPGRATFTLAKFDDDYELGPDFVDINNVEEQDLSLHPRGCTALLDAIGKTVSHTGKQLRNLMEYERPGKVIIVVITDGMENASKKFTQQQVFDMIKHQEQVYSWEFVFLGANQDAIATGKMYGFDGKKAMTYGATKLGTQNMMKSVAMNVSCVRNAVNNDPYAHYEFKAEDRQAQESEIK